MSNLLMGIDLAAMAAANFAAISHTLVTIPGGTFLMGGEARIDEQPVHEATVSTFQMGINPVTNEEYRRFVHSLGDRRMVAIDMRPVVGINRVLAFGVDAFEMQAAMLDLPASQLPSADPGETATIGGLAAAGSLDFGPDYLHLHVAFIRNPDAPPGLDGPRQPAVQVNWFEALAYAALHGGRLPTEWEWEYAARVVPGETALREYATPSGRLTKEEVHYDAEATVDVDDPRYPALPNGLRHMTGNVAEWMLNRYGDYTKGPVTDPTGPRIGVLRALRGGAWYGKRPESFRAARRFDLNGIVCEDAVGFRLAVRR